MTAIDLVDPTSLIANGFIPSNNIFRDCAEAGTFIKPIPHTFIFPANLMIAFFSDGCEIGIYETNLLCHQGWKFYDLEDGYSRLFFRQENGEYDNYAATDAMSQFIEDLNITIYGESISVVRDSENRSWQVVV